MREIYRRDCAEPPQRVDLPLKFQHAGMQEGRKMWVKEAVFRILFIEKGVSKNALTLRQEKYFEENALYDDLP